MGRITETHVAVAIVTMVTVNAGGKTNIPVTLMCLEGVFPTDLWSGSSAILGCWPLVLS